MSHTLKTAEDLEQFWEANHDEFLEFERVENKRSKRPDLHAFLLLDEIVPGNRDLVSSAEHDEIWLDVRLEPLLEAATLQQLIDLHRCGIRCDAESESLCMFV